MLFHEENLAARSFSHLSSALHPLHGDPSSAARTDFVERLTALSHLRAALAQEEHSLIVTRLRPFAGFKHRKNCLKSDKNCVRCLNGGPTRSFARVATLYFNTHVIITPSN